LRTFDGLVLDLGTERRLITSPTKPRLKRLRILPRLVLFVAGAQAEVDRYTRGVGVSALIAPA
jgi:hypothetical protein